MENHIRRYDIDWLRVIAIALLLIYHIGIAFQPWGVLIGFIQNDTALEGLWVPMSMLNIWRIPLLFFVSGMGVSFAMRKRNTKQLIGERIRRIFIPFLFGIAAIVPLHLFLWQSYYNQDISYTLQQSHLWFLGNIFSYVLILSPVFMLINKSMNGSFINLLKRIYSSPLGFILVFLFFVFEALIVNPSIYETFATTLHGYFVGLLSFFFGFTFVASGNTFWHSACKWRWALLLIALALFCQRYFIFDLQAPNYLKAIESPTWIFAAFGFSFRYLNRSSKVLSYLSTAAYPVYILHMLFLYLASYYIMPTDIPAGLKFTLVVLLTFSACFTVYEFIIKRIKYIRPLFGLKY